MEASFTDGSTLHRVRHMLGAEFLALPAEHLALLREEETREVHAVVLPVHTVAAGHTSDAFGERG